MNIPILNNLGLLLVMSWMFINSCTNDVNEIEESIAEFQCEFSEGEFIWYIIAHGQSNINSPQISEVDNGVQIFSQDSFYYAEIKMLSSWVGKYLFEQSGKSVYIVNVGKGGTSLNTDADLDWNVESSGELLDSLKQLHDLAFGKLSELHQNINVIHLWAQGQGDDSSGARASRYQEEELKMLEDLRSYFQEAYPLAIFDVNRYVLGETNGAGLSTGDLINEAKKKNAEILQNAWYIDTLNPLVETSDGIHWTNTGGKEEAARRALLAIGKI